MTDLKLFQLDADGWDIELRGSTVALEVELQRRIEAGMEAMLGIRFLTSEYPAGPWHRGRIDTLGLDENNMPVLIEYKKAPIAVSCRRRSLTCRGCAPHGTSSRP